VIKYLGYQKINKCIDPPLFIPEALIAVATFVKTNQNPKPKTQKVDAALRAASTFWV
jgi:hypothetical protein